MFSVLIRTKAGDLLFPSHAGWSAYLSGLTQPLWYLVDVFLAYSTGSLDRKDSFLNPTGFFFFFTDVLIWVVFFFFKKGYIYTVCTFIRKWLDYLVQLVQPQW